MNDAAGAAPVGTTAAPAAPAPAAGSPPAAPAAPSGGVQQPTGTQQPPTGQIDPAAPAKPPEGNQPAVDFKIPDAYKDKPWAAKIKSQEDLFKQIDNLDALAGKKAIIPDLKTATPEQKEEFYKQLRGKDASEYVIPDNPAFPSSPEIKTAVTEMFMKNGINPVQANEITKSYQELGAKMMAEQFSPDGMKAELTKAFGNDWEATTRQTRNTIKGMMTPEDQAMLDKMPNNYLAPIYRTLGNVIKKFGVKATDTLGGDNPGAGNAGGSGGDLVAQRAAIRTQLANLGGQPHTVDQANELRQKLAETYKSDPRLSAR